MVVFPNAKVNLGLNVISKMTDGFHSLESVFYPVPWSDVLEIVPSAEFKFFQSGIAISGDLEENLCVKVYRSLQKTFNLPAVSIYLHKVIPVGAGLGGGSSDAAFTAKLLNEMFQLHMDKNALVDFIKPFGSDCAFFIENKPAFAHGRGDLFENIGISLKEKYIVLVYPDLFISTKEAYGGILPQKPEVSLHKILDAGIECWKGQLKNDFEENLFLDYPVLPKIKESMYEHGAIYASMSGSGSTVFGIFAKEPDYRKKFPANYSVMAGKFES